MSDAKPRTSLRSYWHTRPKKKEQTPLKTRVRYNKTISVHLLTEPYVDVTAHTAPSQQAVGFPLQGMEVWMNRHQIEELGFSADVSENMHDKSIPPTLNPQSPVPPILLATPQPNSQNKSLPKRELFSFRRPEKRPSQPSWSPDAPLTVWGLKTCFAWQLKISLFGEEDREQSCYYLGKRTLPSSWF